LTELKDAVKTLSDQVKTNTAVLQTLTSSTPAEIPDDLDMELPIASQQALQSVEDELAENRTQFKAMVCFGDTLFISMQAFF
jgi:hypothetical protein